MFKNEFYVIKMLFARLKNFYLPISIFILKIYKKVFIMLQSVGISLKYSYSKKLKMKHFDSQIMLTKFFLLQCIKAFKNSNRNENRLPTLEFFRKQLIISA